MYARQGSRRSAARGFTLTELMIALGLTGLVAVVLLAASQVQTEIQREEGQSQQIQDNLRAAMEELVTSVRTAGSCFYSGQVTNAVPPGMPGTILGINVRNNILNAGNSDSPDGLDLIRCDDATVATLTVTSKPSDTQLVADTSAAFQMNDFVVLSDFYFGNLYRLTAAPQMFMNGVPQQRLFVNAPVTTPPSAFAPGSVITRVLPLAYRVDTTMFTNLPVLTLQDLAPYDNSQAPQMVAENIEDLQVAVGIDGLSDSKVDGILREVGQAANDDDWIYNYPGETLPVPLPPARQVTAVRVTLITRTTIAGEKMVFQRPRAEDRPAGPIDGFRRRVLTTQISVRRMATEQ